MKQPKELYLKEQWLIHTYKNVDSDANENIKKLIRQIALDDWKFIKSLLTQQRTELLEEIEKDIQKYFSDMADLCFPNGSENGELIGSTHYYQLFGNELLKKLEKKKQNTNLLNKKDE